MPDILAMLTEERDKLNRAIEALSVGIGTTLGRMARLNRVATQGKRKTMSAAAKARISAAQKARWAKVKGPAARKKIPASPGKKFTMSPEARARISAGMKARWARIKSGK
jgi:hypothetical protein